MFNVLFGLTLSVVIDQLHRHKTGDLKAITDWDFTVYFRLPSFIACFFNSCGGFMDDVSSASAERMSPKSDEWQVLVMMCFFLQKEIKAAIYYCSFDYTLSSYAWRGAKRLYGFYQDEQKWLVCVWEKVSDYSRWVTPGNGCEQVGWVIGP